MENAPQTLAEQRSAVQAKLDASLQAGRGMGKRIQALQAELSRIDAEEAATTPKEESPNGT